jgi:hypothetical protein
MEKHGKKLLKRHPLFIKKNKITIKIRYEPVGLTEAEIESLLKPINPDKLYFFKKKLNKLRIFFEHLCNWKLIIGIKDLEYKISLNGIVRRSLEEI